jgi:hypothetical protein
MAEASILSMREEPVFLTEGRVDRVTVVVYSTRDSAPRTVRIPGRDPDEETIKAAIRADLEQAAAEAPRTLQL